MLLLIQALLFATPFIAYALWRRAQSGQLPSGEARPGLGGRGDAAPPARLLALGAAAVLIAIGGALLYGLSRSLAPGESYVPSAMQSDGRIAPGRAGQLP